MRWIGFLLRALPRSKAAAPLTVITAVITAVDHRRDHLGDHREWGLCFSLQCECLTKDSITRAFSHLSLRALFITTITLAVNNDDGSN